MRLCHSVPLCCAAAAVLLAAPATAGAADGGGPRCAGTDDGTFPLTTRLHGGPGAYRAGGGPGTWYLDLTNTTRAACTDIHPVVVLVDARRALRPGQPRLEFFADGRPHPVRFERTDEDELVGAFTDGPGFTVGAGRTLSVRLRLALAADTAPNDITANAAVVQRHGDDGDWVGQSNDYRFAVETGTRPRPEPDPDAGTPDADAPDAGLDPGSRPDPDGSSSAPDADAGSAPAAGTPSSAAPHDGRTPDPAGTTGGRTPGTATPGTATPGTAAAGTAAAGELASTGPLATAALAAAAVLLLATGAALAGTRRRP